MRTNSVTIGQLMLIATEQQLQAWYLTDKMSTRVIAQILKTSQPTVRKLLKLYNIQLRTYKDNKTPISKGTKMPEHQKKAISAGLLGKTNRLGIESAPRIDAICAYCQNTFRMKVEYFNKVERTFCSSKCSNQWRTTLVGPKSPCYKRVEVPCKQCGKTVIAPPHKIRNNHKHGIFCGRDCHDLWRSINKTGDKLYNFKGGDIDYYGPTWKSARRLARIRDNNTCQRCKKTKAETGRNMDVHHIQPFRDFGVARHAEANQQANLVCYCNSCHKIIEENAAAVSV